MYSQAVNVDDLESKRGAYSGSVSYAKAKRGLMIITEEWAKQWQKDGIVVHAMHPGWANTDGVINALPEFYKLSKNVLRLGLTRLSLICSHFNRFQRFYAHKTR
jgi:dehydrogenase/reductase SDR family protein 12